MSEADAVEKKIRACVNGHAWPKKGAKKKWNKGDGVSITRHFWSGPLKGSIKDDRLLVEWII